MSECQSVRGKWGEICPDCGERLPNPGPVASWQSQRPLEFTSGASAGLGGRRERRPRAEAEGPRLPGSYRARSPEYRASISAAMRASWARRKAAAL